MNKKGVAFGITAILCITVCLMTLGGCGGEKKNGDVVLELLNHTKSVSLASKSFYPDYAVLSERLMQTHYAFLNGGLSDEALASEVEAARRELQQLGYYYDYEGKTSVSAEDGSVYGADSVSGLPMGGGTGYPAEFGEDGAKIVYSDNEFYYFLRTAEPGDVIYLLPDIEIDLSDLKITNFPELTAPEGITIASGRGIDGDGGAIIRMTAESDRLFDAMSNVRITGVIIQGPDASENDTSFESNGIVLNGTGIVIDNCEISGFSGSGIIVNGGDVTIRNCYIHHIRGKNGGNGILVKGGSAKIEESIFSNCRYGVTVADGASFEARNNVEVGTSLEAFFRVNDGGSADIRNNTVLGYTKPVSIEGTPKALTVEGNLFSLNEHQYTLEGDGIKNNAFNIKAPYVSTNGEKDSETTLTAAEVTAYPAVSVDYGREYRPDIVTLGGVGSYYEVMTALDKLAEGIGSLADDTIDKYLRTAYTELGCFSGYYGKDAVFSAEIDGVTYGAYVKEGEDPIGGGIGYSEIFTTGDYVVDTLEELVEASRQAKSGEVIFIEGHAVIDVGPVKTVTVGAGVTVASNRGYVDENGKWSTGAVLWSSPNIAEPVLVTGENARVSGLVVDGRNPDSNVEHHGRANYETYGEKTSYYALPMQRGIEPGSGSRIDNCEVRGFGHAGIHLAPDTKNVRVDHCYIHHNFTKGLGYGVCHNMRAESIVEYCLFNYNNHSIAGNGTPVTGYIARFNIEMGWDMRGETDHCFDMHGGGDRGDGTNVAGTYCEMYNNTFLYKRQYPYRLRGVPEDYQIFYHNYLAGDISHYSSSKLENERARYYDNVFGGELVK